jgi:hypothetical protein
MVREFVPLPVRGMGFSHGRVNRFEHFETDHPELPAKLPSLKIPGTSAMCESRPTGRFTG